MADEKSNVRTLRQEIDEAAQAQAELDREDAGEDEQEQFPRGVLDGTKTPKRNLIPAGVPVEMRISIGKAEVPLRGGFLPDKITKVIVQCRPSKIEEIVLRDKASGAIESGKWRQGAKAIYAEHVSPASIYALFEELVASEPAAAGALLDQMSAAMSARVA